MADKTDRRGLLRGLIGGAMMIATTRTGARGAADDTLVDTASGRLRGEWRDGVLTFLGVRYASAERFAPPRAAPPAAGIVEANRFGAIAPQTDPSPTGPPAVILAHLPRAPGAPPPHKPPESEDCLFLNVWTASTDRARRRPVMVFLHGGFFYSGSGQIDGAALAARDEVVVVSLNHRLNAFGFAHLEDIAGADFAQAGSLGMLDIVAALEWVRDNIEGFGGDPGRIMTFGVSGGGMKTSWLLASPRAAGLTHRAGVQSGPLLRVLERERASRAADLWLGELGLKPANANEVRRLPSETLLGAYYRAAAKSPASGFTDLWGFAPVLDPALLPRHPFDPVAPDGSSRIPLLIGSNADEMSFFLGNDPQAFALDEPGLKARITARLGSRANAVLDHYGAAHADLSPARRYVRILSDEQVLTPTALQARRKAQDPAPVFRYRFEWPSPARDGALGATHTLENALLFQQLASPLTAGAPDAAAIAGRIADAWTQFAATGEPGQGWAAYGDAGATMRIGREWRLERDPFAAEEALFADGYR